MLKPQGTDIVTRVRLLFVGVLLLLNFVGVAQTQKRCLSVEGNGYVRVVTSLSKEINSSADFCVNFDVKDGGENIDFVIKPGAQYYLEKIEVEDTSGKINEIPQERIYAERDDSLHFQCQDNINLRYFFVFKEVQPWAYKSLEDYTFPYKSRDARYCQIYRASDLYGASRYVGRYEMISIQNDMESAATEEDRFSLATLPECNSLNGNNKTFKNSILWQYPDQNITISDLHILSGISWGLYFGKIYPCSFVGCTANPTKSTEFPIFYFTENSADTVTSHDCINFGDCKREYLSWKEPPEPAAFSVPQNAKNLINWGSVSLEAIPRLKELPSYAFIGTDTNKRISYVFNFGRMPNLILVPDGTTQPIFSPYFNDKNLAPEAEMPTHGAVGYNLESRQLIDSAFMRRLMGDSAEEDFIFEDGFYPRLRHMDERPGRLAASPILLYPGENADSVSMPFYVDTNYGVRWISTNEDVIRIEGNVGYVRHPVPKDTTVRIEAWKEDFSKHVYLTVPASNYVYQELKADTICPGDSVKMINTYARNEGWNYEVVETTTAEYDTIYRMYLHHLPSYNFTFIDSCYIEELPYTVGGRRMQNFGKQTERYVTAEGCDSVYTYVLAPRWHPSQVHGVVTIEGDGIVCMQENTFQGAGTYVFEVEESTDLHFRIKPGKQFYLDSLLVGGGMPLLVSRDSIYAERDDTLHYYRLLTETADTLRFVFKEVQPWKRGVAVPYKSRDKSYAQIYRPEELYDPSPSPMASLQNDLDLANYPIMNNNEGTGFENIEGNNKVIKHVSGNHFYKVRTIKNVHFLDNIYGYPFMQFNKASLENFSSQGFVKQFSSDDKPDAPFFVCNFINFCTTFENGNSWMSINKPSKNIINWGRFDMPLIRVDAEEAASVSYVFNFGSIPRLLSASNGTSQAIVSPCFNDKNLAPQTQMPTRGAVYNLESRQLIDSAFMRSLMGDSAEEDFIFEDGFYPRLRNMDERPGRLAASPILLYPGENAGSVALPFYVDTNYGVRWRSLNEKVVKIEGNVGYVCHPVSKRTTVQVEAWKEDFSKSVYLTVPVSNFVYQDLLSDTVCPGDSVKMIHSYAKNEGWNYEVQETVLSKDDTIYRMYLYHYPTYREVVHRAAVERDSLPYIFGKDTIRQFGLTELHRYQTMHGCDSITYVRLDPLVVNEHIYDTVRSCGPAQFHWQGVVMIVYQGGDYVDSVEIPDRDGAKTYHHLHVAISSPYYMAYRDSCYIEELPYVMAGRPIEDYGTHTVNLVSEPGCDSVCRYVLSRRWRHYRVQVRVRGEGSVNVTDTVLREDASLRLVFTAMPCHKLARLTVDGRAVSPQERYTLKNLHGDCTVEAEFADLASAETRVALRVCKDSMPVRYGGVVYEEGAYTIQLENAAGCDSVIRLTVESMENAARLTVTDTIASPCGTEEIAFTYGVEAGAPRWLRLAFDPAALSAGFRDTVLEVTSTGKQTVRLPLPSSAGADRYGLQLWQTDGSGCYVPVEDLDFVIPYPSDIIVQKWNDVLAVLAAEYNGGYDFTGYQWYRNGEPIEGETRAYYYARPYLRTGDTYAVLLQRASDGQKLMSCGVKRKGYPKEISLELCPNPTAQGGEVQVSVGGKPEAEGIIEVFDGTGKPVYEWAFRRSHTLRAVWQPGTYVVRVRDHKGSWIATGKLTVL